MAYTDYLDTVQKAYIAYFQRPADPAGLIYWSQRLNLAGGNMDAIIDAFSTCKESRDLYGTIDSSTISTVVTNIYQTLLGRTPEAAGLQYYMDGFNAGRFAAGTIALDILNGAQNNDALVIANKLGEANEFTWVIDPDVNALELQFNYAGTADAAAARAFLTAVNFSPTSLYTSAQVVEYITKHIADTAVSTPIDRFSLTTAIDIIHGTSGNDIITAIVGTLGNSDEIYGSAGTDSLLAKLDNSAALSPRIDGVETITLASRGANASFDLANVSGAETINVEGIISFALSGVANSGTINVQDGLSAGLTLTLAANTATAQSLTINLNNASGTDISMSGVDSNTTAVDTLTLNAITNWGHFSATDFSGIERLVLKGDGNVGINLASASNGGSGGLSADAINDLTAIDASSLSGALTLTLASKDINIAGGAGNDTFNLSADWNTGDIIAGGGGIDTINATLTGSCIRPVISGIENLNLLVNGTAGSGLTIDLSNLNDTGMVVSALLGPASGGYVGADGADIIQVGLGAMTVNGGLGKDTITFGNTVVNYAEFSVGTVGGADTIIGAGAGDVLLFSAAGTASAGSYLNSAWNTGTATTTAQICTSSFSAMVTAAGMTVVQQLAIYTSNGNTYMQALAGSAQLDISAAAPVSASDDYVTVILSNKDYTAITAAFQID
ncbi:MAG: hypothetical protein V1736_07200, partial [Pseudomonadota bacterium]